MDPNHPNNEFNKPENIQPNPQYTPPNPPTVQGQVNDPSNTIAVVGFIMAFIFPFIGFILSIIGLKKSSKMQGKGKGLAIAGIILSFIFGIISFAIMSVLVITTINGIEKQKTESSSQQTTTSETSNKTIELGDVYKEKTGLYSVQSFKGWKAEQSEGSKQTTFYPSNYPDPSTFYVSIQTKYPGDTIEYFKNFEEEQITKYEKGTVDETAKVTINGLSGYQITGTTDSSGIQSAKLIVILDSTDVIYTLRYTTSPERSANYIPEYKKSAETFRLL